MTVVSDFRAILGFLDDEEKRWNAHVNRKVPVFVSYSFFESDELPWAGTLPYYATGTTSFSAAQRTAFRKALAEFEKVSGVIFVETQGDAMIRAHGVTGSQWGGWANYPWVTNYSTSSSTIVLDLTKGDKLSGFGFEVILHEIAHAMGLSHTFDGKYTLKESLDSTSTSIMSYNWAATPYLSPRPMDIQALQHIYGGRVNDTGWSYGFKNGTFKASGAAGNDKMIGVSGRNDLSGKGGDDLLIGREGADILRGGAGNDVLKGFAGLDRLEGGAGNDVLWASAKGVTDYAHNTLLGGDGNDRLFGRFGPDTLKGAAGKDTLSGQGGNDIMHGGAGADVMDGGSANDRMLGQDGNDQLHGGSGDDHLNGGRHPDTLTGGRGNDNIQGAAGRDMLTGGVGADLFVYRKDAAGSRDTITDFELGVDHIQIGDTGFIWEDASIKRADGGADSMMIFEGDNGFSIHFEGVTKSDLEAQLATDVFV